MTGTEILKRIQAMSEPGTMSLSPGPFKIRIDVQDARAAELMEWMTERWPELTLGETEDVLAAAIWWTTFLASVPHTSGGAQGAEGEPT